MVIPEFSLKPVEDLFKCGHVLAIVYALLNCVAYAVHLVGNRSLVLFGQVLVSFDVTLACTECVRKF